MRRLDHCGWARRAAGIAVAVGLAVGCGKDPFSGAPEPQRIIAVAPGIVEMLFELGLGDQVAGVGDYSKWPPEVLRKPRLGGLFDPRLETVVALKPDLAILLPSEERLRLDLEEMGIEVLTVPADTIADIEEMATRVAERCGVPERAESFLRRWRGQLAPRSLGRPVRVLLSVTRARGQMAELLVSGPGTFLDELLGRLGVVNIMADAALAYPQVGLEEIVVRNPGVVIELQPSPGNYELLVADWERFEPPSPLVDVCVRVVAGDHVLIPGPRLPLLYGELREALLACTGES